MRKHTKQDKKNNEFTLNNIFYETINFIMKIGRFTLDNPTKTLIFLLVLSLVYSIYLINGFLIVLLTFNMLYTIISLIKKNG